MSLKNLLSSFVSFEEPVATPVTEVKPVQSVKSYANTTDSSNVVPASNAEIKEHLLGLIKENNIDGFDYCEFSVQIEIMKNWPIMVDEQYKSSFAAILAQANLAKKEFTKTSLINSAGYYKTVIQKAVNEFSDEYASMYKTQVEDNNLLVQKKTEEMKALGDQMTKLNTEIQEIVSKVSIADSQLKSNKDVFVNTANNVLTDIDNEVEKITNYIV